MCFKAINKQTVILHERKEREKKKEDGNAKQLDACGVCDRNIEIPDFRPQNNFDTQPYIPDTCMCQRFVIWAGRMCGGRIMTELSTSFYRLLNAEVYIDFKIQRVTLSAAL